MRFRRKFGNVPTVVDGIKFASKLEASRYVSLKWLVAGKHITKLNLQPRFKLYGKNNRLICTYIADFQYLDDKGRTVVEDTKGFITPEYKIKRELFKDNYPEIIFVEIKRGQE